MHLLAVTIWVHVFFFFNIYIVREKPALRTVWTRPFEVYDFRDVTCPSKHILKNAQRTRPTRHRSYALWLGVERLSVNYNVFKEKSKNALGTSAKTSRSSFLSHLWIYCWICNKLDFWIYFLITFRSFLDNLLLIALGDCFTSRVLKKVRRSSLFC